MRRLPRHLPRTLTGRFLLMAVGLVAVVGLLVSASTTVVMRHYLTRQLDSQVEDSANRAARLLDRSGQTGERPDDDYPALEFGLGDEVGALTAVFAGTEAEGGVLEDRHDGPGRLVRVDDAVLAPIADLEPGRPRSVDLPGLGSYRVVARDYGRGGDGVTVVSGLPTEDLDEAVQSLVGAQLLLTLCGVAVAALVGSVLVRRTLRPLRAVAGTAHEVASLPLDTGSVGETARVPEGLTDPDTEVGQVGHALNTLLGHVESALDARHRSEQQVRQFVADASHELRTPLATILGYAELARRSPSYDAAEALAKVEGEGRRMSTLVEDLLLLARLDSGRPLARDEVDLTKLALEAVEDARVVGREHRWVLDLPDEPIVITGDELRLHQVVSNLLTNARRHTPDGTTVTVGLSAGPGRAVVTVTDDGPGIPAEQQATIFERFTRGDASRTRDSGGAGLGLALVQAIVTAHGGTVGLDSVPGRTVFTVTLPSDGG